MDYNKTIDWLFSKLPYYQRKGEVAYKKDIGNIIYACKKLNNPQNKIKTIHIAGTNGKGSTTNMIASILIESGYKTGTYTSPHLKDFRERICINGKKIEEKKVIDFIKKNKVWFNDINMSFFEMTVAMAFNYFYEEKVDLAVIETGLGGRLDSTNIINPEISIITNVSLDHTNLLGKNIHSIASEKAGIIKNNTPIIIGRKQTEIEHIFKNISDKKKAPLIFAEKTKFTSDLKGDYQKENINTTIEAIKQLQKKGWNITRQNIITGLNNVKKNLYFKGRWEVLQSDPLIIAETAHNFEGLKNAINQFKTIKFKNLHFILGMSKDKRHKEIFKILPKNATYYFSQARSERSMQKEKLYELGNNYNLNGNVYSSVNEALIEAKKRANKDDLIFIGGSIFVISEVL